MKTTMQRECGENGAISRPKAATISRRPQINVSNAKGSEGGRRASRSDCAGRTNRFINFPMGFENAKAMKSASDQDSAPPLENCGLAAAIEVVGDRWTLLIIRSALYGVTRFDELQTTLSMPRTVLSNRLKMLVENGVLRRRAYKEEGQRTRHQYVLTQKGVDLALPLMALMQWGQKHALGEAAAGSGIVSRRTGQPLHLGLIDVTGVTASLTDVQFRKAS